MDLVETVSSETDLKLLRSLDYNHPVFVHFKNQTERHVDIIWIDYEGQWIRYKTLPPGGVFEIDTYVTHPWVFMDDKTKCRLIAVGRGDIFCPVVSDIIQNEEKKKPLEIDISIPLLSLREKCLEVLCQLAADKNDFTEVNLCRRMVQQLQEFYKSTLDYNILDLASVVATCEEPPKSDDNGENICATSES